MGHTFERDIVIEPIDNGYILSYYAPIVEGLEYCKRYFQTKRELLEFIDEILEVVL